MSDCKSGSHYRQKIYKYLHKNCSAVCSPSSKNTRRFFSKSLMYAWIRTHSRFVVHFSNIQFTNIIKKIKGLHVKEKQQLVMICFLWILRIKCAINVENDIGL